MLRIALSGGERKVRIGDVTVRFDLTTRSEYLRATNLGGERVMLESLVDEIRGAETVWDVGACVGTYTCFVAKALSTGHVVGFEPEPANRTRLRTNLARNAPKERWSVSPVALSGADGESVLMSEFVEAGGGHHHLSETGEGTRVETKRGDSLISEESFSVPDILKIDVQGAEMSVLRGLGEFLEEVGTVYVEIHPEQCKRYGTTSDEIEAFLRNSGYSLMYLGTPATRRSGVYFCVARR